MIGLGLLADADDEAVDEQVRLGLQRVAAQGDELSRRLADRAGELRRAA